MFNKIRKHGPRVVIGAYGEQKKKAKKLVKLGVKRSRYRRK